MSFDGGVTETKFALGQMLEMSALNCRLDAKGLQLGLIIIDGSTVFPLEIT
jgi:hypothetical protein